MKNIQKFGRIILVFLLIAGITSCEKKNNVEAFEVFGDVMIIKRMVGDQTIFARSYFAYGNYQMSSAEVTIPEGTTLVLTSADEKMRTYLKEPSMEDFTSAPPQTGSFEFTVVNEDIEHMASDQLTFNNLPFANITRAEHTSGAIMVEWESVAAADMYTVRLVDENYQPVFTSFPIPSNSTIYQITSTNGYMHSPIEAGATYTLEVNAFDFEAGADDTNYDYNVNEISSATTSVVWGE